VHAAAATKDEAKQAIFIIGLSIRDISTLCAMLSTMVDEPLSNKNINQLCK
jgi:hypothetical protein